MDAGYGVLILLHDSFMSIKKIKRYSIKDRKKRFQDKFKY